jgi:hypothetical protein
MRVHSSEITVQQMWRPLRKTTSPRRREDPQFKTHRRSWNELKLRHISRQDSKPKTTVLARTIRSLLVLTGLSKLVLNYGAENVAPAQKDQSSSRLRTGPILKHVSGTETKKNIVLWFQRGPKLAVTVVARVSSKLPLCLLTVRLNEQTCKAITHYKCIW